MHLRISVFKLYYSEVTKEGLKQLESCLVKHRKVNYKLYSCYGGELTEALETPEKKDGESNLAIKVVRPTGHEPVTLDLEVRNLSFIINLVDVFVSAM
jgi:hypothetical protein